VASGGDIVSRRQVAPPQDDRPRKTYICRCKRCGVPCIRDYAEPPKGCPHGMPGCVWYELVPVAQEEAIS